MGKDKLTFCKAEILRVGFLKFNPIVTFAIAYCNVFSGTPWLKTILDYDAVNPPKM